MHSKRLLLFLFLFLSNFLNAGDLFWVGGSGNWDDTDHWSLTSGGVSSSVLPTINDNVYFDVNSFDGNNQTVNFSNVKVNSFNFNNSFTPSFIGNSIEIVEKLNLNKNLNLNTNLVFNNSTNDNQFINTGGFKLNSNINIQSGIWELKNHLILLPENNLKISSKEFIANEYTISAGDIFIEGTKLNLENASLNPIEKMVFKDVEKRGGNFKIYKEDRVYVNGYEKWKPGIIVTKSTCGTLTVTAAVTSNYNGAQISCSNACDAEVTVTTSGNTGPFGYSLNSQTGPYQSSNVLTGVCAGGQQVWVIDSSQTTSPGNYVTCSENITPTQPFGLSYSITPGSVFNPSCPDICDGSAIISPSNGTGTINVVWGNGETGNAPVLLCTGPNPFTLTDDNGCVLNAAIVINAPVPIVFDIALTDLTCFGESDGELLLSNISGGNGGPYTNIYTPAPTSGQGTLSGIGFGPGNVTVSVFDIDGCQQDSIVEFLNPPVLTVTAVDMAPLTCFGVCNGSLSALPVGGVPGYTFEWFDDITGLTTNNTDSVATGLCAGTYFVTVTDSRGCQVSSAPVVVNQPTEMTFTFAKTDVACIDDCTGNAIATVIGGQPNYNYTWIDLSDASNIGSNASVSNLCSGLYEITVIDDNGCASSPDTVEILNALPIDVVFTSVNPDCYDICNGEITATPTNSTGFLYSWNNGLSTAIITNQCVDFEYILTTTDDSGCVEIDTFNFTPIPVYDITATQVDLDCFTDQTGSISVTVNSGANGGPYSYDWTLISNPPAVLIGDGTASITNLSPGTYTVNINDAVGTCDTVLTFILTSPTELIANSVIEQTISCFGICDGEIASLPSGGTTPYTFEWIDVNTSLSISNDSVAINLCGGSYYLRLTDGNGCIDSANIELLAEPTEIITVATGYDLTCFDVCDGAGSVTVTGGTPNYMFQWVDIASGNTIGIIDTISGLCPGDYEITVIDASGCSPSPDTINVLNALEIQLTLNGTSPLCFGDQNGNIAGTIVNGTAPFIWSPIPTTGQNTNNANYNNLIDGFYTISIADANGCLDTDTLTLASPAAYDISETQTDVNCFNGSTGTIDITVNSGGLGGGVYTYNWLPGTVTGQGTPNVSNLSQGFYQVTISDGNCDTTMLFEIDQPEELVLTTSVISDPLCAGDCNGSGDVFITGGTVNYSILWNDPNAQNTNLVSNLCEGTYQVTVTDNNLCVAIDSIVISNPVEFSFTSSQTDLGCFGGCVGTASISNITGGNGPYTVQWNDPLNQSGLNAFNLCQGPVEATITDINNCDTVVLFDITEPLQMTWTTALVNSACFGSCSGQVSIAITGGASPIYIAWFNTNSNVELTNGVLATDLCPGLYYAIVIDANGCSFFSDTLTVTELPEIIIAIDNVVDATCGATDGSISISAAGGAGNFSYLWTPNTVTGQGTTDITNLDGGVYSVVVTDMDGCTDSITTTLNSGALEILALDSVDVSCFGLSDGEVNVAVNCLEPTCNIEWFDIGGNSLGTNNTVTGLPAGKYYIQLINGLGCIVTDSIEVNDGVEIISSISSTPISCFGADDGTATVIASGGVGVLTYDWTPIPSGGQNTAMTTGLTGGLWNVSVADFNGCSVDLATNIDEPDEIIINSVTSSNISCFGLIDGELNVQANGGTGGLTYEWFNCLTGLSIGNTQQILGVSPGEYNVVITDATGCSITSICVEVENYTQITAVTGATNVGCFGDCNGLAYVTPTGGNGNYFYQWLDENLNPIVGQTNDSLINICQGVYHVNVTDGNGCLETFGPMDLTQPLSPWDVTIIETGISCFGDCNGTGSITVNNGNTAPYSFQWDDPLNQTTSNVISLCPGVYNVLISDAGTCDTTVIINIADTAALATNAIQTDIDCNGDCIGEVTLTPSGGTGPYSISWTDFQIGAIASNLCSGAITATIIDDNGCSLDSTFNIIEPLTPLSINSSFSNITQCNLCNGSATVNINGGTPPYTYVWSQAGVAGQGTNQVTALCAGLISVEITDFNGCIITETFVIADVDGETFVLNTNDATCFNTCDGDADITYTCIVPTCSQIWIDAATGTPLAGTNTSIANLCPGDYIVQLTNGAGCVSAEPFTILSPAELFIDETITEITCSGAADGSIVVAPSGGSGAGYVYVWTPLPSNGQGTNSTLNLGAGDYTVDLTDSDNCTISETYTILDTIPITYTNTSTQISCNTVCDGSINIIASGGYGNYTYQWFDNGVLIPGETSATILNLCVGDYTVEITDFKGCSVLSSIIPITEPLAISASISKLDITCFGACDGSAWVVPVGGTGTYIINWYDVNNVLIGQSNDTAFNLCEGTYYAIITDANNCSVNTPTITIIEPAELTFNLTNTENLCFGECTAMATIVVSGGVQNYIYNWLDNTNTNIGITNQVLNLCDGGYTIEVVDQNGCSTGVQNVIISDPAELTGTVFSNSADCNIDNGNATINVQGGMMNYTYQWFDANNVAILGETNNTLNSVLSGAYSVEVTDANNCSIIENVVIDENPSTTILFDEVSSPTCFNANDGFIEISISGNNLPLNFLWNPGGMVVEDPVNLIAGTYSLTVTDAAGCVSVYDTTLTNPDEIIINNTITDPLCGECNGEIDLAVSGGVGALVVNWNNGGNTNQITNLCPGIYEVNVSDDNGCTVQDQLTVGNSQALDVEAIVAPITCPTLCDGDIAINVISGTGPYDVLWLNDGFTGTLQNNLCPDTYFIEVTDANGCMVPLVVELVEPTDIIVTETVVLPNCGVSDGSISVVSEGGILPHVYAWNTTATTPVISNLDAGIYTLTVTDDNGNGCSQEFVFPLSNVTVPQVDLTADGLTCFEVCDGSILANVVGGTPGYTFAWFDENGAVITGENSASITDVCSGEYFIEVTDLNGCMAYASEIINEADEIILTTPIVNDISCFGLCDGSIQIGILGGLAPYTYAWNDPGAQTDVTAINLCQGIYDVDVLDANNCLVSTSAEIIEPSELIVVVDTVISSHCKESTDGEIQITVTGGEPTYTFEWTNALDPTIVNTEDVLNVLATNYFLSVTDLNGCILLDTIGVDTAVIVIADAGNDTIVCYMESIELTGTSNQIHADFTWYDDANSEISDTNILQLPALPEGVMLYILTASFDGCDDTDSIYVTSNPDLVVDAGLDEEIPDVGSIQIGGEPTVPNGEDFYWTPSIYLNDSTLANPTVIKPQFDTWYYVTIVDTNGCFKIDSMFLDVIPQILIPSGISPNGDGKNDTWILDFKDQFPNLVVTVFNRWGDELFYNEGYTEEWDGQFNGKELPVGTYYYVVNLNSEFYPEPFTGPITIMR